MAAPTLINLPPPPSDPVTPSELGPGTPNSTTTSLSALSTTAIKDGYQGAAPPHAHYHHGHQRGNSSASNASTTTLDAERADRISRLAGLERVATVRQASNYAHGSSSSGLHVPGATGQGHGAGSGGNGPTSGGWANQTAAQPNSAATITGLSPLPGSGGPSISPGGNAMMGGLGGGPPSSYFDQAGNPVVSKERSTVGSASATGSAGGRTTTWTSMGSDDIDVDGSNLGRTGTVASDDRMSDGGGGFSGDVDDVDVDVDGDGDGDGASNISAPIDGMSDEGNASLVGFGEAASSTVSGPISSVLTPTMTSAAAAALQQQRQQQLQQHQQQQQQQRNRFSGGGGVLSKGPASNTSTGPSHKTGMEGGNSMDGVEEASMRDQV